MRSKCNYVFIAMQLFGNKYIVGHREGRLVLRVVICMLAPLWPVRPKVTRRGRLGLDIATTSSAVCVSDSLTQCMISVLGLQFPGNSKKKWTYVWTYVWPAGVNDEKLSARFFHRKLLKNKLFKKVK